MRKILYAFLIALLAFSFVGCSCGSAMERYDGSISEYRKNVWSGNGDCFSAEMISGYRESDFKIDGVTSATKPYTLITVCPIDVWADKICSVTLVAGDKTYSGEAQQHPFKQSYSFEIGEEIEAREVTVTVKRGESESSATLTAALLDGQISGEEAFSVALDQMEYALKDYKNGSRFEGEIFIRFISNPISTDNKYYWYVAFIPKADPEKVIAALIDPDTGAVEAKRES